MRAIQLNRLAVAVSLWGALVSLGIDKAKAAPVLQTLDFTPATLDLSAGPAPTVATLSIDSTKGFFDGRLRFHTDDGGQFSRPFDVSTLTDGDEFAGTFTVTFDFPAFAEPGPWSITVDLQNTEGDISSFGSTENPLPLGSTASISITNNGYIDTLPPELLGLSSPSNIIEISNSMPVSASFDLEIEDDGVGLWAVFLRLYGSNGQYAGGSFTQPTTQTIQGAPSATIPISVLIPAGFPSGPLYLAVIMEDHFGQRRTYNASPYFNSAGALLFPPHIDPYYLAALPGQSIDSTAPEISDAQLSETVVNLTGAGALVDINLQFSETADPPATASGVENARLTFVGPDGQVLNSPISFSLATGTDVAGSLAATLVLPSYLAPGTWQGYINIWDENFNNRIYGPIAGLEPPGAGWSIDLHVENFGPVDLEPPALLGVTFSVASLNVSDGAKPFFVEIEVSDDATGVSALECSVEGDDLTPIVLSAEVGPESRISGTTTLGRYAIPFLVPEFTAPQALSIRQVGITDGAGRRLPVISDPPILPGAIASLTVFNSGDQEFDGPVLDAFSLDVSSIDATNGPGMAIASMTISDDASGFASGVLFIGPYIFEFDTGNLVTGSSQSGTYSLPIPIGQHAQPDVHSIWVVLEDLAENSAFYADGFGTPFPAGAPTTLEIINTGMIDNSPPVLQSITSSSTTIDLELAETLGLTFSIDDALTGGISGRIVIAGNSTPFGDADLIAGTSKSGTWHVDVAFPPDLPASIYGIELVVEDALGESVRYGNLNLAWPGGFVGEITVLAPPAQLPAPPPVTEFTRGGDGSRTIAFLTVSGYPYTVERSVDLLSPWVTLFPSVPGNGGEIVILDSDNPPPLEQRGFYRVSRLDP